MRFPPLIPGRLLRRYKRFLADVELPDGRRVVAHCPNPGAMTGYRHEGLRVMLSEAPPGSARKLRWTWELARPGPAWVLVNTARSNQVVAEALEQGRIVELATYDSIRREQPFGTENSRVDFLLSTGSRRCFCEVKQVTLAGPERRGLFPDAVSKRGARHLRELMHVAARGDRAVLLFCLARADCDLVAPADAIDPEYSRTLREAADAGVEILAYRIDLSIRALRIGEEVSVDLG